MSFDYRLTKREIEAYEADKVDREWIKLHRDTCPHDGAVVNYDDVLARGMSVSEVRAQFPRFFGTCPDCGSSLIKYASWAHYAAGDW
jgi:hypothetical protein